jgi:hypothetical protein
MQNGPMSFVLVPDSYDQVVTTLKNAVPEFTESEEYQLHRGKADDLPGVILCSFARYLARVSRTDASSATLTRGVEVIGTLWQMPDYRIKESVEDEFFDELADDQPAVLVIVPMMEPTLREAYSRWADNQK